MTSELEAVLTGGRNTFAQWENGDASEAQVAGALWALIDVLSTPPADDMHANNVSELLSEARVLVASWDLRGSWTSESPIGLVARLADALKIAGVRPHGTFTPTADDDVRAAVEVERQRAAAHAREGYRANENCDDITKRILSGEPAEVEIPGHAWPPPADDVREAAQTLAEHIGWRWESLEPIWQRAFTEAARKVLARPHGTVTDAEALAKAWDEGFTLATRNNPNQPHPLAQSNPYRGEARS